MSLPQIRLFVLDTGPLITLAAADSLDYLLYPSIPVVIPDAVFYEATRDSAKLGAQSIIDWVKARRASVEIAVTYAYSNFDAARTSIPLHANQIWASAPPWRCSRTRRGCLARNGQSCCARKLPSQDGWSFVSGTGSSN